ncbi:hypothetical protein Ppa06_19390 [Planomonospora parontospora subsp. parontospora]|uniref:Uncharacterized protein n=2 Tax=Planomonospora parontospora TaxID=58119 RepID=A0AA37F411_9ACTN|nr:hypothetical protein GCM10010126_24190 [Planomonospora parontospora]GII08141.1 hypothetical protein Ppa06_19390 [Planomonospora parontospora subsp. parontospora]
MVAAVCLAGALTGCGVIGTVGRAAEEAMADPAVITEDAPFKGSPSEGFAEGIAGIEVPEAEAVGRFPAKDVRAAYKVSRRLLEAAYLDEQSLLGGKPEAYARLLDPEQRKFFLKNLDHKDEKKDTRAWVFSFEPGTTELVGDAVKVKGRLSAAPGKDKEVGPLLVVTYEARFVYAVRPAGKTGPIVRVMAYTKSRHEFWRDEPGGRLRHWEGDSVDGWNAGVECDSPGRFHRPDFRSEGGGDGPLQDAYADGEAPMEEGECGSVEEI